MVMANKQLGTACDGRLTVQRIIDCEGETGSEKHLHCYNSSDLFVFVLVF